MNTTQLRINGFSVNSAGHIECYRRKDSTNRYGGCRRYAHEHTGVLTIVGPREVVDQVIAAVDEPSALIGRTNRGNAVMLFRVELTIGEVTRRLEMRDGSEVSIVAGHDGMTLNPELYSWPKGRSPADVRRNDLPPLLPEHVEAAYDAAWAAGARPADEFQRERETEARVEQYKADLAAGKIETDEQRIQSEQEETVRVNEGKIIGESDGVAAQLVLAARRAVAWRRKKKADQAA